MKTIDNIVVFGQDVDRGTLDQAKDVARTAEHVVLMADNHLGYIMPIGGVAAYNNKVSISGVGFDIACGNAAIKTDLTFEKLTGIDHDTIDQNPHRVVDNGILKDLANTIFNQLRICRRLWMQMKD